LPKQRELPLLDIEALEGVHNRGHGDQLVGVEQAVVSPAAI
jgi:hypothetical protein